MAEALDKNALKSLEVTPYETLRKTLRSGDLLFASGNYWVSRAIQKVTESPWSHVGIVFNLVDLDRVLLLESVESVGVRFAPLSKYLYDYKDGKPYRGELALARVAGVDAGTVTALTKHGIDELTRPYDANEIAKILARVAMGQGRHKRDREYICSELVHACFKEAGTELNKDRRGFISPDNIWRDERVELIGRVR